ncbi:hypothetical protein RF11_11755 [Thelohanellus kitauei]|uniref:Uncharacterized protein n=1 Tax=Thelohanellus kitauei TaxID=669202 RepID=A0A0C2NBB6_THEKT|nr:hypothetical protein RF11_11755 [Thelohanellus kitauei]
MISYLYYPGNSWNNANKMREIARILDISETIIRYIIQTKLTEEVTSRLKNLIRDDNLYALSDIQHHLEIYVHDATIWKWFKNLNFLLKITRSIPESRIDDPDKLESVIFKEFLNDIVRNLGTEEEYSLVRDNPVPNPCEEAFYKIKNEVRRRRYNELDNRPTPANGLFLSSNYTWRLDEFDTAL